MAESVLTFIDFKNALFFIFAVSPSAILTSSLSEGLCERPLLFLFLCFYTHTLKLQLSPGNPLMDSAYLWCRPPQDYSSASFPSCNKKIVEQTQCMIELLPVVEMLIPRWNPFSFMLVKPLLTTHLVSRAMLCHLDKQIPVVFGITPLIGFIY